MNVQDYLKLSINRLAELNAEKDERIRELTDMLGHNSACSIYGCPMNEILKRTRPECPNSRDVKENPEYDRKIIYTTKNDVFEGVGIQHIDGTIYSLEDWRTNEFKQKRARGIAVGDGIHSLCLYKKAKSCLVWSSDCKHPISGVYTTTDIRSAEKDFSGKENTDIILKAVFDGLIHDAPAAQWVNKNTFDSNAYLPGAGELTMIAKNKDEISKCSDLIGGNLSEIFKSDYWYLWSSTQFSDSNAWFWSSGSSRLFHSLKCTSGIVSYALACAAL